MEDELSNLSATLNIDESRLSYIDKNSHYSILLDSTQIGIWSEDLMDSFYEESLDVYNAEYHDEDFCNESCNEDYCKYKDNTIKLFDYFLVIHSHLKHLRETCLHQINN